PAMVWLRLFPWARAASWCRVSIAINTPRIRCRCRRWQSILASVPARDACSWCAWQTLHCCLSLQQTRRRLVGDKGTVHPSDHQFETAEGQTILDAALSAGYVLPYSCRSGSCSTCKGKVLSGTFDAGPAPAQILSAEDISAGYTLFCQAHATSDMDIEVREV